MGKKIYLSVIYIITLLCMIIGILGNVFNIVPFSRITLEPSGTYTTFSQNYIETIQNISIAMNVGSVTICHGNTMSVEFSGKKKYLPDVKLDDNDLIITQSSNVSISGIDDTDCTLIITVPEDVQLDNIFVQLNIGDISVKNLNISDVDIDIDIGSLQCSNITTDICKLNVNMGDIKVNNCECNSYDLSVDMGDIKLTDIDINQYSNNLSVDLGDIKMNGNSVSNSYITNVVDDKRLTAYVAMGSIKIN
jgi:hypothetical protein